MATVVKRPEFGALIGGSVFPGSEWIRRDLDRWWKPGSFGTRKKDPVVNVLTGHWTAGEAGGPAMAGRQGPRVYDVMKNRDNASGEDLRVSIAFVIEAPADPNDPGIAPVWQFLDPGLVASIHVGTGWFCSKSIGVEVVSGGMPGKTDTRKRPQTTVDLMGDDRTVLEFYPAQLRAWIKLADMLSGKPLPGGINIPRQVPNLTRRLTGPEARRIAGGHEHWMTPGTTKLDAAGLLTGALASHGWAVVNP